MQERLCKRDYAREIMQEQAALEPTLMTNTLDILYQDEALVVINKPAGMMTHRSRIAEDDEPSAMELLRDQLGSWVYPIHRLDRATSGALIFGLDQDNARVLHESLAQGQVQKTYWAITRGHAPKEQLIDRALKEKRDRITDKKAQLDKAPQEARTLVQTLAHLTLPVELGRYPSARFSLVEVKPLTGRRHQIRRHLAGINYPLIGDTTHGRGEQNRFFRTHFNSYRLLLAAVNLKFTHPITAKVLDINAPLSGEMADFCRRYFFQGDQVLKTELIQEELGLQSQCLCLKDLSDLGHLLPSS